VSSVSPPHVASCPPIRLRPGSLDRARGNTVATSSLSSLSRASRKPTNLRPLDPRKLIYA
jgi:hypothetical protein